MDNELLEKISSLLKTRETTTTLISCRVGVIHRFGDEFLNGPTYTYNGHSFLEDKKEEVWP